MKNFVLAIVALIIVVVVIFLFASGKGASNDTIIPSPQAVESPKLNFSLPEASKEANSMPFPVLSAEQIQGKKVKIATTKGNILIELSAKTPLASSNFLYLAGKHFYDGLTFHRVIKGFMIQGGDPKGDGTGGPGYKFADEAVGGDYVRGTVAMANAGPNTNGSQFFIMHQDYKLPPNYTIFGKVTVGMDVVDAIANSQVDENDKPLQMVTMAKVEVLN